MQQPLNMCSPSTEVKIEVVLPIARRACLCLRTVRHPWTRCRECRGTNRHCCRCNKRPQESKGGAHCFNLVKLAINDRTHVVPPSFEYDSSYWCESGLMSDHMPLTRISLSFTVLPCPTTT